MEENGNLQGGEGKGEKEKGSMNECLFLNEFCVFVLFCFGLLVGKIVIFGIWGATCHTRFPFFSF